MVDAVGRGADDLRDPVGVIRHTRAPLASLHRAPHHGGARDVGPVRPAALTYALVHTKMLGTRPSSARPPRRAPPCPSDRNRTPVRRRLLALVCVSAALLSGCGLMPGDAERSTVTVWLMQHSASQEYLDRFTEEFEREHPALELDIRVQEWTGIGEKVQKALEADEEDGPDVIEVGNTQVATYAEGDGLLDLTLESLRDWGRDDWLPGLAEPGRWGSQQYGIPWYAANRVVIYRKDLFRQAGVTAPPKTRDEWL